MITSISQNWKSTVAVSLPYCANVLNVKNTNFFVVISNCEYYLLLQVVGNRTMLKPVLNNAIVKSVSESLMSSVNDAYKAAERSSGAEWRSLSTTEKFLRIFREVNMVSQLLYLSKCLVGKWSIYTLA